MGITDGFMKMILIIFNILLLPCGLAVAGFGMVSIFKGYLNDIEILKHLLDDLDHVGWLNYALIIGGGAIVFLSLYGCCGAAKGDKSMMAIYAAINIILLIGLLISMYIFYPQIQKLTNENIEKKIGMKFQDYDGYHNLIDPVQKRLQCCGFNGHDDYKGKIPYSCCENGTKENNTCNAANVFQTPCKTRVYESLGGIGDLKQFIYGVVIGTAIVEAIVILFSLCLAFENQYSQPSYA